MEHPETNRFTVLLQTTINSETDFVMPVWTPGYYQKMDFGQYVSNFSANDESGKPVQWKKTDAETWSVSVNRKTKIVISYDVTAARAFVASSYLGADRAYIIPGALFMYPEGELKSPSIVKINPINNWTIATGLPLVQNQQHTYFASDFDILYDSPLLVGPLESLPKFEVRGVPHYFIGYQLGEFDRAKLMVDLKKIVETAVDLIGHIPYKDYTFIAIGPGQGGIEHLNSTTISFNGNGLNTAAGRHQLYNFIAHEYFHQYNVKRIRPIELGPFDYKKGSRTNMLWVSEGLSVYYEYLVVKRAGLMTDDELFKAFTSNILAYESKPGRHYQSLVQASYNTWSDGPFGRTDDEINRTISYYDKGPVVGLLLDFEIRQATKNKKSLDDLMRKLYYTYDQRLKRGFTETELWEEAEKIAGKNLAELRAYTTTTKELDYQKYLNYAGLQIDTVSKRTPNLYTGMRTRWRSDSLVVTAVDYESPAWVAGVRNRDVVLKVDGQPSTSQSLSDLEKNGRQGETYEIEVLQKGRVNKLKVKLSRASSRSFSITRKENPTPLQQEILNTWLTENVRR